MTDSFYMDLMKKLNGLQDQINALRTIEIGTDTSTDTSAVHKNEAGEISGITEKTTIADNDIFLIEDSAALNAKKRLIFSRIKTAFNALFAPIAHVGSGGAAHADVTTSADGFMTATDKTKLNGITELATRFVPLTTPLTSTSWDGDAKSTTAKTKIDLSVVFGVPAKAKGIFVRLTARDSGSSAGYCQLALSPNATAGSVAVQAYLQGVPNDVYVSANGVVPCDANGDVYYQIASSGTGTLDAFIEIWGYWE